MDLNALLQIISIAAAVIKSRTSPSVDDKIDEGLAIAKIVAQGRQAYVDATGQPLDESLIREQALIP